MHTFFLFVADFTRWQQHRLYSACRAYISVLDPGFDAKALYLDDQRVGWTFFFSNDEARQRLIVFFTALTGTVLEEQPELVSAVQDGASMPLNGIVRAAR